MMPAAVPREALASAPTANRRRYRSPSRVSAAEQKKAALIAAVLILISFGNYRGTAHEVATLAGVRRQAIARYFGGVDLLYRAVARDHWQSVRLPASCLRMSGSYKDIVWLVLVGKPPQERS
jgi:AcrR family transcriptional regulator